MKPKAFTIALILILISSASLPTELLASSGDASQIDSIRKQREALVAEQHQLEAQLNDLSSQSQTLGATVKTLDATRKKLESDIKLTQSKIAATDQSIRSIENNVNSAETKISAHKQAIMSALQAVSSYDSKPFWMEMLSSVNFAEAWRDKGELLAVGSTLDEEVNNLKETKSALLQEKSQKEKAKQDILKLNDELKGQKTVVADSQNAKQKLLAETQSKEAAYQQMLKDNLELQREYDQDIFKLESQLNLHIDQSTVPSPQHGLLDWPFDSAYMGFCASYKNKRELGNAGCVTQSFTYNASNGTGHNGVDLRAAVGTAVYSIASGVVEGMGNSDDQRGCYSYGRWILIKHDNGLTSIYGHLSASLVKVGQSVSAGDLIGYSGGAFRAYGSGNSQAPHLHLGLFASQGVEIKPFTSQRYLTTGQGCHDVPLPVALPTAYLNPLAYMPAL